LAFPNALQEGFVDIRKLPSLLELAGPCVEATRESLELVPKFVVIFIIHWIGIPIRSKATLMVTDL
jgi:hypothetical protein